jgi:hypothetical protein
MKKTVMRRISIFIFTATTLLSYASFVEGQATRVGRSKLIGTWRLVSAVQHMDDGSQRPDPQPGPNGVGYIIYTDTGQMCAMLSNPDRPKWRSTDSPTEAELRSAMNGLVAYCGTYEVNEKEGYVLHHIEFDRIPNLAGTDRKRLFTITGKRLVLRPSPPPAGIKEWTVEWERVAK